LFGHRGVPLSAAYATRVLFPPLLPVGFHNTDVAGLQRLCVDYFPGSRSRPKLMNTVSMVVSLINRVSIPSRLWIDGPFLTEEDNPDHCCVTLVLVESVHRQMTPEQHEFFDWFRDVSLFEKHRCNNYAIVLDAERPDFESVQSFWFRQYGFHDRRRKKGVAEILLPMMPGA
jgi:hypothetical protein